jgi:hypothetical protein
MILVLADLNRTTTILRNQHLVTLFHTHGYSLSILVESTGTNSQDFCLVELLDRAFGEEDAASRARLSLDALDEHSVKERNQGADGFDGGRLWRRESVGVPIKLQGKPLTILAV